MSPGLASAAVLLLWYVVTMARGLAWFDAGELALVGQQLGLGHPPGQPLYTLALGLFARLPGVDPLVGMNLLSALCAAACAIPADALLRRLTDASSGIRITALLAVGAMTPVWDQATRIELYSLATLLSLTLLAAGAAAVDAERRDARAWAGLGLLSGLLASVNPVFALAAASAVGLHALRMLGRGTPRAVLVAALGAVVGLTPYLWIFVVRDATDRLVWGELHTAAGLRAYLTGADYAHTDHAAWSRVPGNVGAWLLWLTGEGAAPALLLGFAGWLLPGLRRALGVWLPPVLAGAAFTFTYGDAFHPEVPDYNGYLAPAMWLGAVGLAALAARSGRGTFVGAAVVVFTLATGARPLWERSRASLTAPERLADAWLESAPERAILVVQSDHLVFPLMYRSELGARPDVVVLNEGFAASSWYWRHLLRRHPDLPRIELAAPDNATRLRRLFEAAGRPVVLQSGAMAAQMGLRPCLRTWGVAVGPACADAREEPDAFSAALDGWPAPDPITPRVRAALGFEKAVDRWALGDASGALEALRAGVGEPLPVPLALRRPPDAPPLVRPRRTLIADPADLRVLGATLLQHLGRPEAEGWR